MCIHAMYKLKNLKNNFQMKLFKIKKRNLHEVVVGNKERRRKCQGESKKV